MWINIQAIIVLASLQGNNEFREEIYKVMNSLKPLLGQLLWGNERGVV